MSSLLTTDQMKVQIAAHWGQRAEMMEVSDWHVAKSVREDRAWARVLRRHAPNSAPVRLLDLGTGLGYLAGVGASLGFRATGIDVAPRMIELARTRLEHLGLEVELQVADADALPFPDGSFDLVTERNVLWTMPEPGRTLDEIQRVLRPGGRILAMESKWLRHPADPVPSAAGGAPNLDVHYREFRQDLPLMGGVSLPELRRIMAERGYTHFVEDRLRGVYDARVAFNAEMARPRGERLYLLRADTPLSATDLAQAHY